MHGDEGVRHSVLAVHELSKRVRASVFTYTVILALAAIVLLFHKSAVTDQDFLEVDFPDALARELLVTCPAELENFFDQSRPDFDSEWLSSAEGFLQSNNTNDKIKYLITFLNQHGHRIEIDSRDKHRRLLVDYNPRIRQQIQEHLEDNKDRWQGFVVPVINLPVSREEVSFYLAIAFSVVHLLAVAKYDYLREIRLSSASLKVLPDPSLITASAADLRTYLSGFASLHLLIQQSIMIVPPLIMIVMLWWYFVGVAGGNVHLSTRLFAGLCSIVMDVALTLYLFFWFRRQRLVNEWKIVSDKRDA